MKAILASTIGGSIKQNGKRIPGKIIEQNGLLSLLQSMWMENARVLIVCASPYDYEKNDSVCYCLQEAFSMSGLSVSSVENCDQRTIDVIDQLSEKDVLILAGGHVPTQNQFMKQLKLRERLADFHGIVLAWSAGSMNCADVVYAGPECEGEAIDPNYERWISGLGITKTNIFPHFDMLRDDYLDGMRLIEDITFADSMGHEILALNNGSFLIVDDGKEMLYGEAYMIKDAKLTQICKEGETVILRK